MLYISRRIGVGKFGVVDTEDNVEEVVDFEKLDSIVHLPGIEIAGTELCDTVGNGEKTLYRIKPYQLKEYCSALQVKTAMLRHTEITTWGDFVTNIYFKTKEVTESFSLRLSDFGSRLADCVFMSNTNTSPHVITLIFDDKIKLERDALVSSAMKLPFIGLGTSGFGLLFDIREVTDLDTVYKVYEALDGGISQEAQKSMLDIPGRREEVIKYLGGQGYALYQ